MLTWDEKVRENRIYGVARWIDRNDRDYEDEPYEIRWDGELTFEEAKELYDEIELTCDIPQAKLIREGYTDDTEMMVKVLTIYGVEEWIDEELEED